MNRVIRASLALAFVVFALPSVAQEQEMRPYVYGGYEYNFQDDARDSGRGQGYFFGAGKALNKYWGLEFGGFHDAYNHAAGFPDQWRAYGGELDGLFFYSRNPRFSPYVDLGVGGIYNELKTGAGGSSTDPMVAAGVGFFKFFDVGSGNVGMRADVRYRWSDTSNIGSFGNFNEPQFRVGMILALGPKPAAAASAMCADSDKDGVCDDADLCPNTKAGVKVNAKGCPIDSDGDGVADDQDRCPGTSKGVKVDANGCPIAINEGATRKFEDVHFEFDRSELTDYGKAILDNAASAINSMTTKYPKLQVEVQGHTDWIGTDAYNQALSERRAITVKQYLVRKGVDASRITTQSYGEAKPIATNDTAEGRALNRRGEVRTHD